MTLKITTLAALVFVIPATAWADCSGYPQHSQQQMNCFNQETARYRAEQAQHEAEARSLRDSHVAVGQSITAARVTPGMPPAAGAALGAASTGWNAPRYGMDAYDKYKQSKRGR